MLVFKMVKEKYYEKNFNFFNNFPASLDDM